MNDQIEHNVRFNYGTVLILIIGFCFAPFCLENGQSSRISKQTFRAAWRVHIGRHHALRLIDHSLPTTIQYILDH